MKTQDIQKAQKIAGEVAEQLCANAYDISKEYNSVDLLECVNAMSEFDFVTYTDKNQAILPIIVKLFNSQDKVWQYIVDRAFKVAIKESVLKRIEKNNDAIAKCKESDSPLMPKRIELYERFNTQLEATLEEVA